MQRMLDAANDPLARIGEGTVEVQENVLHHSLASPNGSAFICEPQRRRGRREFS
jgi:hypothetical protein